MHRIVSAGIIGMLSIGAVHAALAQEDQRLAVARAAIDPVESAASTAPLLDRPARLVVRDVSLSAGLLALQDASGVPVAYSSSLLPPERRVSCSCDTLTVRETLGHLLAGTRLRFSEFGGQILIEVSPAPTTHSLTTLGNMRLASLTPPPVNVGGPTIMRPARTHIRGTVVNGRTGVPLAGAEIGVRGSGETIVSDANGRFDLTTSPQAGRTVEVRKAGYHARTEYVPPTDAAVRVALSPSLFGRRVGGITGQVTDAATGEPIPSAQVLVEGTTFHAITQDNGRYLIQNVPNGIYAVSVKRVGYAEGRKDNINVTGDATVTVDFRLATRALTLEQVVVTGVTDPISGKKVPFSVGRISGENVSAVPTTGSAATALQGKVAGVSVIRAGGQPGSGSYIQLRTPTGIEKDNGPLFVIDGIPLGSTLSGTTADLATMDIESIEVIEGAAASSLYGSRAANGVVQIRTKRGTGIPEGQTRFTVRSEIGMNEAPRQYPLSTHHAYLTNEQGQWLDQDGNVTTDLDERVQDGVGFMDNAYGVPLYNNVQAFFKPSQFMQNSISIAQNSPSTNFFISAEDHEDRGALADNGGFWRRGVRLNLDHRVGSLLKLNTTAYHSRTHQDDVTGGTGEGGIFWDLLMYPPEVNLGKKGPDGQYLQAPDPTIAMENPIWRQHTRDNFDDNARTQASVNVRFTPLGWLTFTGMGSYDNADRQSTDYTPKGTPISIDASDPPSDGSLSRRQEEVNTYNTSFGINMMHRFGGLTGRLNLLATMEEEQNKRIDAGGSDFAVDGVPDIDVTTEQTAGSRERTIRGNGYYAQTGFDYNGKYIADILVRRDGSSLFGPESRWQTYYRGAGAWLLSEESWWPFPSLNLFKLRYAIGTAGQRPDFDDRFETWSVNGNTGRVSKGSLGNRNLKPGRKTEQEIGLDLIALDRFSLKLTYASQETKDQIIGLVTPAVTGYSTQIGNAGTQKGTTYEATLEAEIFNSPEVSWSTTFVADRSRSRITEFGRACYIGGRFGLQKICPGSSLSDIWGAKLITSMDELAAMGITSLDQFQVNDDGYVVAVGAGNSYRDGVAKDLWGTNVVIDGTSYKWGLPMLVRDSIGLPVIQKIGSSQPDVNLGWLNNVRWHHFTLHTAMQAQLGGQVYNGSKQRLYQHDRHADLDQFGKPDALKKTLEYYHTIYNRMDVTSAFLEPGWYVKLREVSLLYNLDRSQLQHIGLGWLKSDRISLGLIGRNVLTFDNYSGFDPEVGLINERYDYFGWPLSREFTGTIQIAF